MSAPVPEKQIGGTTTHVRDCYIWAQIHYLDSPTDYRECLQSGRSLRARLNEELIMLGDMPSPRKFLGAALLICALALATILAVTLCT
jgi:hypothetical protein